MSFYSMIFGQNNQADLLLAVIGFRKHDVERFRDAHAEDGGKTISVYTRTGGGNRPDYPQVALKASPLYVRDEDDDFDSTYATFYFRVPDEFVADVAGLADILANGLRAEFVQHLAQTLRREPTEADKAQAAYDQERAELARLRHVMANGHTFVPLDDWAMEAALKLAEANEGKLRSCWGIAPIKLTVDQNKVRWPKARDEAEREKMVRAEVSYDARWAMDAEYWAHCQRLFGERYPQTMAAIAKTVAQYIDRPST